MTRNIRSIVLIVTLWISACSVPARATTPYPVGPALTHPSFQQTKTPVASETMPAPTPVIRYQPTFESAPCAFPVPRGYDPECGYLVVPENRARADSRLIRLHVGIFRNRTGTPSPDPVIKLSGGPGSSGLNTTGYILNVGLDAVLETRDLIVFDQRGTGYSRPRLDCPERSAIASALLGGRLTDEESKQAIIDSFRRCRERLISEGIDISAYNSVSSAADIYDLRSVLGYERLNIYAISYGTRLALTVMRDHPEVVRSAVLDSAYPLQVNLYTTLAPNAERAFNVFFDRCAADSSCSTSFPNLRGVFYELVDELNARPIWVSLFVDDARQKVQVDGGLLIDVLFVGLYNPAVSANMPRMIYDTRGGDYTILEERLMPYLEITSALGMQMAVQCAEEIPFGSLEDAHAFSRGVQPQIAAFFLEGVRPLFEVCRQWTVLPPDPRENVGISSDIPTLVLSGEGDPITPPAWGQMVTADLLHAYFHEFPATGHWVLRSSPCAVQMALSFYADPTVDPGSLCQ